MKYPVISEFVDKHTKVYYAKGAVYETEKKARAEELQGGGFIDQEIEAPLKKESKKTLKGEKNGPSKVKSS